MIGEPMQNKYPKITIPKTTYRIEWVNLKTNKNGYQYMQCYSDEWRGKFERMYPAEEGYIWTQVWNDDHHILVDFQDPIYPGDIEEETRTDIYDYDEEE